MLLTDTINLLEKTLNKTWCRLEGPLRISMDACGLLCTIQDTVDYVEHLSIIMNICG